MSTARSRTVGVLGGMGPAATADFFSRVVAACSGGLDQDHIRLIIDNNPFVPDRNAAADGEGLSPGPVLAEMARGLERAGAKILVMPCNAAHAYKADILAATPLPFVDMIEETANTVARVAPGARRVGVLAADACLEARLYQAAVEARDLTQVALGPERQADFMALLYRVKAGDLGDDSRRDMAGFAAALMDAGAEVIIAGCTEVPLVLQAPDCAAPLLNSTDVLAASAVREARDVSGSKS